MRYLIPLFAYAVVICLLCIVSKHFRKTNPKYSTLDDVLLFGGLPITMGYFYFVMLNPKNDLRLVSEVVNEHRSRMIILMVWMVVSSFIYLWRNREDKLKYPKRKTE